MAERDGDRRQRRAADSGDAPAPDGGGAADSTQAPRQARRRTRTSQAASRDAEIVEHNQRGANAVRRPRRPRADRAEPATTVGNDVGEQQASQQSAQRPRHNKRAGGKPQSRTSTPASAETPTPKERQSRSATQARPKAAQPHRDFGPKSDSESLRLGLTADLLTSAYECMICYDNILHKARTWNCSVCYGVFHLKCVQSWASTSHESSTQRAHTTQSSNTRARRGENTQNIHDDTIQEEIGNSHAKDVQWRCPGCQSQFNQLPKNYTCYCGKMINPPLDHVHPHSCGNTCARNRGCRHVCADRCHPGPCDPCENIAPNIRCYCGRKERILRCKDVDKVSLTCGAECGKKLNCKRHTCAKLCHSGDCNPCPAKADVTCGCGKLTKTFSCGEEPRELKCTTPCGILNICGNHTCEKLCHRAHESIACDTDPSLVSTCHCGKTNISDLLEPPGRVSCLDPIPVCDKVCDKKLDCGHRCPAICHEGPCPTCEVILTVKCDCGYDDLTVKCSSMKTGGYKCNRLCTTMLSCGRHRCNTKCCTAAAHYCARRCDKRLSCTLHNCMFDCGHEGPCHPCYVGVSFEPKVCHCGKTSVEPPIPCNAPSPKCRHRCIRRLPCGHPHKVAHDCHGDDVECPRCMIFVSRSCKCGRVVMNCNPCSIDTKPSCGIPCPKFIPECGHACALYCHTGPCGPEPGRKCAVCVKEQKDIFDDVAVMASFGRMGIVDEFESVRRGREEREKMMLFDKIGQQRGVINLLGRGSDSGNDSGVRKDYLDSLPSWDLEAKGEGSGPVSRQSASSPSDEWVKNVIDDSVALDIRRQMENDKSFRWEDDDPTPPVSADATDDTPTLEVKAEEPSTIQLKKVKRNASQPVAQDDIPRNIYELINNMTDE